MSSGDLQLSEPNQRAGEREQPRAGWQRAEGSASDEAHPSEPNQRAGERRN